MRRSYALGLAAVALVAGLIAGAWIDDFIDQDRCLDQGGAWLGRYCAIAASGTP